jgi:hypothetical protein
MGVHPTVHDFLGQELASQSSNSRLEPSSQNTWHTAACDGPPGTLRSSWGRACAPRARLPNQPGRA